MAKKKKGGDARGYATSTKPKQNPRPSSKSNQSSQINRLSGHSGKINVAKNSGKSTKKVQVSQSAQDQIVSLLDELKLFFATPSDTGNEVSNGLFGEKRQKPISFSVGDKKMVKKVATLNDNLRDLGFKDEQIKSAFVAVISGVVDTSSYKIYTKSNESNDEDENDENNNPITLDALLDWLCMHLSTEELPKLFTDSDPLVGGDEKLSKVTFQPSGADKVEDKRVGVWDLNSNADDEKVNLGTNISFASRSENQSALNANTAKIANDKLKEEEEAAARKEWLLRQYQYEEDEGDGTDTGHDETHDEDDAVIVEKSVEEIRLERLENKIKEDKDSLNDDAANYMRSKYEIADLKKKVKRAEQQAKGLRAKIAKIKAKEAEEAANDPGTGRDIDLEEEEEEEEDYNGGICGLFGSDTPAPAPASVTPTPAKSSTPTLYADIPSGWTGKLPKSVLLEYCRKRKMSKPTFLKMPGTSNGCSVKVKNKVESIVEYSGPFSNFKEAEHFASTKALYFLDPQLPMYQLLPPTFRNLWKSWLSEKEASKIASEAQEELKREEMVMTLVKSIYDALPNRHNKDDNIEVANVVKEESKELVDWDDEESWESETEETTIPDTRIEKVHVTSAGKRMMESFEKQRKRHSYQRMKKVRDSLPMAKYQEEFLKTVQENAVTVLCAETGAGKTTQCPQFILEEALEAGLGDQTSIICTQPRRISALSVAERVAEEMDEHVGDHVGYQIRMESKKSKNTRLMFCTTGVVLRRLQDDPNLKGVTCVCVDECHERQWQIDFLLIALRKLLQTTRKDLKVVLMSATLDSELFCSFFGGAPFLSIPGRTFPVNQYYLEDVLDATGCVIEEDSRHALRTRRGDNTAALWVTGRGGEKRRQVVSLESELDSLEVSELYEGYSMSTRRSMEIVDEEVINFELIEDLLTLMLIDSDMNRTIVPPDSATSSQICYGSVLIFLPGIGEIRVLNDILKSNIHFCNENRFQVIPMHSTLSPKDQKRAFMTPKEGCRKIILATNIAETSVTIADCVLVIDTGLERQIVQNKRSSTSTLVTGWCSRASSKQRAGRAGRVQPGICCKLYSSRTANVVMKKQSTPELQRVPLEEVCLSILAGKLSNNCMDFLLQAPQPPAEESVRNALKVLEEVGAINPIPIKKRGAIKAETITPLGCHLSKLPVHVRLGKMLIFGALFGVLDRVLTIVASLNSKSPFITNINDGAPKEHRRFRHPTSDFLTACNAWEAYVAALDLSTSNARKFCSKNFLNRTAFVEIGDMRKQFLQLLSSFGFVDNSVVTCLQDLEKSKFNKNGSKEEIINAAICAGLYPNVAHITKVPGESTQALFHQTQRLWLHKSSCNHNRTLESEWVLFQEKFATTRTFLSTTTLIQPFCLLLFGDSIIVKHTERKVVVDNWIEVNLSAQLGVMFRELRGALSIVLKERMDKNTNHIKADVIIDGICRLLAIEAIENSST